MYVKSDGGCNLKRSNQDLLEYYQRLRGQISTWAEREGHRFPWIDLLLIAPDLFYLILRLASDPEVAVSVKAKLTLATLYFLHPVDMIPELFTGPAGYLDDIVLSAYILHSVFHEIPAPLIEEYWTGSSEIPALLKRITGLADQLIGSGMYRKIRMMFR